MFTRPALQLSGSNRAAALITYEEFSKATPDEIIRKYDPYFDIPPVMTLPASMKDAWYGPCRSDALPR